MLILECVLIDNLDEVRDHVDEKIAQLDEKIAHLEKKLKQVSDDNGYKVNTSVATLRGLLYQQPSSHISVISILSILIDFVNNAVLSKFV